METQSDFKELFESLNAHNVEYLVVGGYALAFYGSPRFTGDIDVWVRPDELNAKRLVDALNEFGFASLGLTADDFKSPATVVQLGLPPARVDLMTSVDGVSWPEGWTGKTAGDYAGVRVYFIGRKELVANKKAVGRHKDLADIESLGEDLSGT